MINKDTEIYCSFAEEAGNVGCKLFNSSFNYYGMDKIYKSSLWIILKMQLNQLEH